MWYNTKATEVLGIQYPIIQGPFGGGLSSIELTSTVSKLGGLGSFGAQPLSPEQIIEACAAIQANTDKPFAINLWVSDIDERMDVFKEAEYKKLTVLFKPYFDEVGVPIPEIPVGIKSKYNEQVDALLEARPPVFSFVFGIPSADILEKCKERNIRTIGTATTVDEALALANVGVDAVVATGFEAGGHRVSFIRPAEDSLTGIFSLIPQVADALSIPVIAAGGIADGRGIAAALTLGADAVQIGTAFLATRQSNATEQHKRKLFSPEANYTTLTKVFSGRLARGIKSRLTEELRGKENSFAPYPLQSKFLSTLREASASNNQFEIFWSGQSASLLKYKDATELFESLLSQTERLLKD